MVRVLPVSWSLLCKVRVKARYDQFFFNFINQPVGCPPYETAFIAEAVDSLHFVQTVKNFKSYSPQRAQRTQRKDNVLLTAPQAQLTK